MTNPPNSAGGPTIENDGMDRNRVSVNFSVQVLLTQTTCIESVIRMKDKDIVSWFGSILLILMTTGSATTERYGRE